MAKKTIVIEAEDREKVTVDLVGEKYEIDVPKTAFAMNIARRVKGGDKDPYEMMDLIDEWLDTAFGDDIDAVRERLADPKDKLDIPQVMELMQKLAELVSENPTT